MDRARSVAFRGARDYTPLSSDAYSAHQRVLAACAGAATVLDVGCSAGALAEALRARGAVVDGIEADPQAAAIARAHCRDVITGDVATADLGPVATRQYDAIIFADVLEHIPEPARVLRRLRGLVAPGGVIVISTPNVANWSMRLMLLAGIWEYRERGIMDRTHVHFFTKRSLLRTLTSTGYAVTRVDVTSPVPAPLRRPPLTTWAYRIALAAPKLFAYQFVVTGVVSGDGRGG